MTVITSASGLLAMLDEEEPALRVYALKNLNLLVGQFWAEISANISTIESLYEDETFDHRELAALLASKVFYYLGELTDSLTYALGAGSLFDVSEDSEYVQTLIAKCIDEYMDLSVKRADSHDPDADFPLDPRLVAIVERMLDNCIEERQFQQAIGVALECRRLDKLEAAVARSGNSRSLLAYCLQAFLLWPFIQSLTPLFAAVFPACLAVAYLPCRFLIPLSTVGNSASRYCTRLYPSLALPRALFIPLTLPLFALSLGLSSTSHSPSLHPLSRPHFTLPLAPSLVSWFLYPLLLLSDSFGPLPLPLPVPIVPCCYPCPHLFPLYLPFSCALSPFPYPFALLPSHCSAAGNPKTSTSSPPGALHTGAAAQAGRDPDYGSISQMLISISDSSFPYPLPFLLPQVLSTLVRLYQQAETPDYGSICQMLMSLSNSPSPSSAPSPVPFSISPCCPSTYPSPGAVEVATPLVLPHDPSLLPFPLVLPSCPYMTQVLSTLVCLYQQAETPDYGSISQMLMFLSDAAKAETPDYSSISQMLMSLSDAAGVAATLDRLIIKGQNDDAAGVAATLDRLIKGQNESDALLAYQVAFDLFENEFQQFLLSAAGAGSAEAAGSGEGEAAAEAAPSEEVVYAERLAKLKGILSGETPIGLTLQFLYSHNKADLGVLKSIKQVVETRNSVCHSATIVANAFMHAGTTVDTFLRDNLDWLSRATNWAKFSATAGLGVIHRGHLQQGRSLMAPYLPHGAGGSAGAAAGGLSGSAYSEGGALYALGLIHANHGESIKGFLLESLRNTSNETIQHGACLGVGLAAMGTGDEEVYEDVKSVLYTDSAVAGEAAGIAMGLLLVGSASERAAEMLAYAHDTQHEKIIRGLAVGISLVVYGREEEADILIQQMTTDADPILRYGGMYAIAMAYRGTANNGAIRQLLHFAVSDVSDDVRRAAVLCLGFVLCAEPDQVPRMVSLLAESFNPHVRYGAAMAVGIACAGTAQRSALDLLEPLTSDGVDFVRQGALMATAMVLMQCSQEREPRVVTFRRQLEKAIHDKHEDTMCKMGAILASGILDAGGRNVTISLRSRSGYDRVTAVIGMALFTQYWYWFPLLHFLSLSFSATALVGLQEDLKAPKFDFISECRPGLFAYPPPAVVASSSTAVKAPVAVLSTAARAKGRAKEKEEKKEKEEEKKDGGEGKTGDSGAGVGATATDGVKGGEEGGKKGEDKKEGDAMEVEGNDTTPGAAAEAKKPSEPTTEILHNPARVLPAQEKYIKFPDTCRYAPIRKPTSGFLLLKDRQPGQPEEFALTDGPNSAGAGNSGAARTAAAAVPAAAAAPVGAFRRSGGGGAGGRGGRGGGAPPPPPPPADDDEEDDEPAPPEAFDFR
ncbi:unnamed protein product [Closterium sp. Yama58-4]|nr:unnamed protein product [Closterium sp. Yama58-4]